MNIFCVLAFVQEAKQRSVCRDGDSIAFWGPSQNDACLDFTSRCINAGGHGKSRMSLGGDPVMAAAAAAAAAPIQSPDGNGAGTSRRKQLGMPYAQKLRFTGVQPHHLPSTTSS